ncbi:MAG: molybdopterin molybdenumtransferase MoeA [Verrucomicrobia bacterium]|nr:MAG: molybdopterin molybdenumtransferase MoeA [Verrucomicrobiota bacterium]
MDEIEDVWAKIDRAAFLLESERVLLDHAHRRVLAETALAREDNPPFDQSAVDGYALSAIDETSFLCEEITAHAGDAPQAVLRSGMARRVLTGGVVPSGTQAIVMQEHCELRDGRVFLNQPCKQGSFLRHAGAIWKKQDVILEQNNQIDAAAIGLLAAAGVTAPSVRLQPRVVHWVTGNELYRGDGPLPAGAIRDSNGPLLRALLDAAGAQITQYSLRDDGAALTASVTQAQADILIISGGAGHSERDHARAALLGANFEILIDGVNSRPGKPLIFGQKGSALAFGLPGNPLSQWVCYHVFVKRALHRLLGLPVPELREARLGSALRDRGDGRKSWQPARLTCGLDGLMAHPLAWQHSGDLTQLPQTDALILAEGNAEWASGELVKILPISMIPSAR